MKKIQKSKKGFTLVEMLSLQQFSFLVSVLTSRRLRQQQAQLRSTTAL